MLSIFNDIFISLYRIHVNNKRRNKIEVNNPLKSPAKLSMSLIYDIPLLSNLFI